jgi:hypothetical protein
MDFEEVKIRAAEEGRYYGETWRVLDPHTHGDFYDKVLFSLTGTEERGFKIDYIAEVLEDGDLGSYANGLRYIVHLWAGKNGSGKWNEYFIDAVSIINRLTSKEDKNILYVACGGDYIEKSVGKMFNSAYLIKWTNDCADDVSDLYIGIR